MKRTLPYAPLWYGALALLATVLPLALSPEIWPNLFVSDRYMPHGHCFLWEPGLIRLHLITDSLIGISYVIISGTLIYLVYKGRQTMPFHWVFIAFGVFIIACGGTHFMDVWTLWRPLYWVSGGVKLVTAVASVVTAGTLPTLVPKILSFARDGKVSAERGWLLKERTVQLAQINQSLIDEMAERARAEKELHLIHEEALSHSERRYHTLAEIAPVGIFHGAATGGHIYVNETWSLITGLDFASALNDGWTNALHPDDRIRVRAAWDVATRIGGTFKSEFRFIRPDGKVTWVLEQAKPELNSTGEVVGYVGTVTDITQHMRAEESLKLSIEDAQRANHELSFYKFALDQAAIVAVTDPAGTIKYVNDTFCKISGYAREELLGQNHRVLNSGYHPKSFFKEMYGTIAAGKVWRGEIRNRAKDGRIYWVDTTIIPTKNAQGGITQYVAIRADITERKNVEAALEANRMTVEVANRDLAAANHRLSELYQTSQRFVDDVSHEFRTPLSVIKGYSELMHGGLAGPLNSQQTEFTHLIIERSRDLAQMVDDLLDTSKIRAGSLRVDRKPCDISAIFDAVRSLIEGRAATNGVELVFQIEPGLPRAFADAEKASRVLVNLAVNAIKFSSEGSRVVLKARAGEREEIQISVSDEGPGISPENLAVIFQRFRQIGEAPSTAKGFGLGLNIARELVSLNLGQMNVTSELTKGSTFSFTLPVNDPRVVVMRLLEHLEAMHTPEGELAALRVIPDAPSVAPENLRGFLASVAHRYDVILTAADKNSLILFGYCDDPNTWQVRLSKAGANIREYNPSQKLCPFSTEMLRVWHYPDGMSDAISGFLEVLGREHAHA